MPVKGIEPRDVPERFRPLFLENPWVDSSGMEVLSYGDGKATLRFPFDQRLTQYQGVTQGGVLSSYADAAIMTAVISVLPEGADTTTTDLSIAFVRPAKAGPLLAKAEVVERGKTLVRSHATVEVEGGAICARCNGTNMILRPRDRKP